MKLAQRAQEYIERTVGFRPLFTATIVLLLVYLLMLTSTFWLSALTVIRRVLTPFLIGFGMAFILHPIALMFERFKVKRSVSVLLVIVVAIVLLSLLFSSILPNLIDDLGKFGQNIVESLQQLYKYYIESSSEPSEIVKNVYNEILLYISNMTKEIPTIITGFLSSLVSVFTTVLFSFIIGIYFVFDYERFTSAVGKYAYRFSPKLYAGLKVMNSAVLRYLKTQMVIIAVSFIEYTLLYTIIGHNYALILGVLTAIAMLIPYIGPTVVHTVGILTCLSLGIPKTLILAVLLVILSQVDGYVVSPMIYSKRDKVEPLWSLFSFFACSTMFGFLGVFFSMPLYFSIRSILKLRKNDWDLEKLD